MHVARGGDVIFVSRVLETYGTESVRYAPEAQIRHVKVLLTMVGGKVVFERK